MIKKPEDIKIEQGDLEYDKLRMKIEHNLIKIEKLQSKCKFEASAFVCFHNMEIIKVLKATLPISE
jgi:hypothetical protein